MNPEYTHAVRIEVEDRIGTGVLYFPPNSSQFYVVTARHVIYGDQEPQETVIQPISLQNISRPFLAKDRNDLPSTTPAITAPDKEYDLTILLVDTSLLEVSASLSNPEAVSSDYGLNACSFTGFPDFAEGEIRKISCFFEGYPRTTPDRFLVRSSYDLSDTDNKSEDNVRGASGSGFYFHYESRSYLAGIITDYTKIDSFYGTGVTTINKLLLSKGLAPIATVELVVDPDLKAVHQNNKTIQARIKSTVGMIQVPRVALKNNIQVFQNNRVFLVHGNAGAGKSAFARDLVAHFRAEYEVFAFSGEQFSRDTLELVFQNLPTPITRSVDTLLTNPNFRPKKLFWIESAEKLIETGKIDALIELLDRVKDNSDFKVLITLRTYMLDILQLYINLHLPQDTAVVPIANFSDEELEVVVAAYPDLRTLLTKNKISNLLHVPFYLNYAVRLLHLLNQENDLTESKFRQIIWGQVIEKGNKERGDTFEALAVKRAKDMSLYTQVDAASDIIAGLHGDHLIVVENDELKDRYCPAHDILEDWALMRYILRNRRSAGSPEAFFRSVGNELPIRRAFRLWLGEALQVPDGDIIDFIDKTLSETTIAPHWKDELYISILRSDYSENFIGENAELLLGNNRYLAYKFINILKTACKEARKGSGVAPVWDLIGAGWAGMVKLLYANRSEFDDFPFPNMFFMAEWGNKLENGSRIDQAEGEAAGLLALHLLEQTVANPTSKPSVSDFPDLTNKLLKLIFDLAGYIPTQVLLLLNTARSHPRKREALSAIKMTEFYDKVLQLAIDGTYCKELCRQFPEFIIQLLTEKIRPVDLAELHPRDQWGNRFEQKVEYNFGLKYDYDYKCYPSSSLQTPAYWLLFYHPAMALKFLAGLFNYCVDIYKKSEFAKQDELVELEITLNDGSKVIQTGSGLLWTMYRGPNGYTPAVLQSFLMALEKWLFDLAGCRDEQSPRKIRQVFRFLYSKSRSVCPTGVMASVAMRFPDAVGDLAFPLFPSKKILQWDAIRATSDIPESMFKNWGDKNVHEIERELSNELFHRRIRNGVARLILYHQGEGDGVRNQMWSIIDHYLAHHTSENEGYWQKLLTEIDSRKYKVERLAEDPKKGFLSPAYDGKAKEIVEEGLEESRKSAPEASYMDWINKAYENEDTGNAELVYFRTILTYYRNGTIFESLFARPATLAVIALRDFNADLSGEERNWCFDSITNVLQHLILERENRGHQWAPNNFNLQDKEPVLYFTPSLIILSLGDPEKETRLKALFCQLILAPLYPQELSKLFFAARKDLWRYDPDFAFKCFVLLLAYGNLIQERSGWRKDYSNTDSQTKEKETNSLINQVLLDVHSISVTIELSSYASGFYSKALAFVPANQDLETFRTFAKGLLELHLDFFNSGDRYNRASEYHEDREAVSHFIPRILLGQPREFGQPIVDELYKQYEEHDPLRSRWSDKSNKEKFIESIVQNFIHAINLSEAAPHEGISIPSFWKYWHQIDNLNQKSGKKHFSDELLLDINWSEKAVEWSPLEHQAEFMKELIERYGIDDLSPVVRLLASIGDKTLMPNGISLLVRLHKGFFAGQGQLLRKDSIRLIQRAFYRHGRAIRADRVLLDDFIYLLDQLTDFGFSEAYWIREDMITYRADQ